MPQMKIPGKVDNIVKNVCVCIQDFFKFYNVRKST